MNAELTRRGLVVMHFLHQEMGPNSASTWLGIYLLLGSAWSAEPRAGDSAIMMSGERASVYRDAGVQSGLLLEKVEQEDG